MAMLSQAAEQAGDGVSRKLYARVAPLAAPHLAAGGGPARLEAAAQDAAEGQEGS